MRTSEYEIPCPSCGHLHGLEESELPEDGHLACAGCGEGIQLRPGPSTERGASAPGPAPLRAAGPGARQIPLEEWEPEADAQTAVATCPACGHLFDPAATGEARRTILVVEDTEYFLQLATTVLRERYETLGVRTTRDARQVLKTREVDLILLDVRLEDGDGAEVLQALRGSSTPVLLYSNRDESSMVGEEWARLRRLGVTDVIHKGLNIEESLLQKVDRLLSGVASGR